MGAVAIRDLMLCVLAALVVREIMRPELDVVRVTGADDPAGGVLDGVPDRRSRRSRRRAGVPADAVPADAGQEVHQDARQVFPRCSVAGGEQRGGPAMAGASP
ncbi:hypothetical protein FDG2_6517 [Candidatus Protofrankia californiensis]|uniref:Uncharacterized protein n=1 Tax=Candidatus Protofrankia californiensis TaxID=1839754 RepID=A0A1C3PH42_9ACTN|nr:hypothetical protein FDG2_6517 [Candidatus Protofrankia californiensis]